MTAVRGLVSWVLYWLALPLMWAHMDLIYKNQFASRVAYRIYNRLMLLSSDVQKRDREKADPNWHFGPWYKSLTDEEQA